MAHRLEAREFRGVSEKLNGCILDHPNQDTTTNILHHVFCLEKRKVFTLSKRVYDATMKLIDQKRKNDRHRIIDESLKFGDFIVFTYQKTEVVDFEKSNYVFREVGEPDHRGDYFHLWCVFSPDLSKVLVEHFGVLELNREDVLALNEIPTPNVVLMCYLDWDLIREDSGNMKIVPQIYKVHKIDIEIQDFASQAPWNVSRSTHMFGDSDDEEDDVQLETNEAQQVGAKPDQKAFITGLTSVFIPEMPSKVVVLYQHNLQKHWIGRETQCDLIFNETLNCYVVFNDLNEVNPVSTHYYTTIRRSPHKLDAIFYVQIALDENIHGFYRHGQFKLIADPFGYLDVARFATQSAKFRCPRHFIVPVIDRLGGIHDFRSLTDLDLVTRFEIAGEGDVEKQISIVGQLRRNKSKFSTLYGVVINEHEGRVFGYNYRKAENYHGFDFILPQRHTYKNGDVLEFDAERDVHPEISRPTFNILRPKYKNFQPNERLICKYENGWFFFEARYDESFACYVSDIFGYVPCKVPPPAPTDLRRSKNTKPILEPQVYQIRARENTRLPDQTIFCKGEYLPMAQPYYR